MKTVELRQAFAFTCEECGRDNFVNAIQHELSKEEKDFLNSYIKNSSSEDKESFFVTNYIWMPEQVICQYCNIQFTVEQ